MKYRFEILYQSKFMQRANEFLSKCDLGIEGFGVKEVVRCTTNKEVLVSDLKENIKLAYEFYDCKILNIEGGKIE